MSEKFKLFFKSHYHTALAGCAVVGFLVGPGLIGFLIGAVVYALGLVYLPDLPPLKKQLKEQEESKINQGFINKFSSLTHVEGDYRFNSFAASVLALYNDMLSTEGTKSVTLHIGNQLDQLLMHYKHLLEVEDSINKFNSQNPVGNIRKRLTVMTAELKEIQSTKTEDSRVQDRLIAIKQETITNLEKQISYSKMATDSLLVVSAEIARLEETLKLLTVELKQTKTAASITDQINGTLSNLATTNESLAQIAELTNPAGLPSLVLPKAQLTGFN